MLLKVLTLNKVISFSKRALHAGTIHNKWRKYAQSYKLSYVALSLLGYSANFFFVIANEVNWKTAQICLLQMFVIRAVKSCLGLFSRTQDLLSLPSRPWFVLYLLVIKKDFVNVLWIGWLWKIKYSKIEIFTSCKHHFFYATLKVVLCKLLHCSIFL